MNTSAWPTTTRRSLMLENDNWQSPPAEIWHL